MVTDTVNSTQISKERGLTLIELLISMVIALVIIGGVITIYSDSVAQSRLNANVAQMDQSSRFALDQMAKDIRMAGFSGCLAYDRKEPQGAFWSVYQKDGANNYTNAVMQGIQGFDVDNTGWGVGVTVFDGTVVAVGNGVTAHGPSYTATEQASFNNAAPASDSLRLWSAVQGVDVLTGFPAKDADFTSGENLLIASNPNNTNSAVSCGSSLFNAGDLVLYSSCGIRMVTQVCGVTGTSLLFKNGTAGTCNNAFPADRNYSGNASDGGELFKLQDITYYVGASDFVSGEPSLFRGVGATRFELAPGVENMQLLFGYSANAVEGEVKSANTYASATQLRTRGISWNDVVSIRVTLLVRSPEQLIQPGDQVPININGQLLTPADGYLRRVYTRTISLRNRVTGY